MMAEERPSSAPPAAGDNAPPLLVNLQIVSPSVGVGNLRFPSLPTVTTVRQLKERIRESLPWRPADDHQRLIHRGRLLARDTDTLHEIFGEEAIRTSDQQTIHLVVRDASDIPPSSDPSHRSDPHIRHHVQHGIHNTTGTAMPRPGSAPIGAPHATIHLPNLHQQQELLQRLNQLQQREVNYRQLLAQQQSHRAAMAHHGFQDGANNAEGNTAGREARDDSPVRSSQTVTREGAGPDGQRYSFRITVNEVVAQPGLAPRPLAGPGSGPTPDPIGPRPLSAADVRNIIHGADAARAAQAMTSAMQRNASGAPPANMTADLANPIQPIQPGVTTPIFPGLSRSASRAATPDTLVRPVSHGSGIAASSQQPQSHAQTGRGQPEVYILSSPTGPRGLLISGASEIYTTPAARQLPWMMPNYFRPLPAETQRPEIQIHQGQAQVAIHGPGQTTVHIPAPYAQPSRPPSSMAQQQPLPQAGNEQPPAIRHGPVPAAAAPAAAQLNHPGNPGAGALVAAAWPHIWLIIRLVAFVWWFSYSDPSWERWLSLALAAFVVFAVNTGIFNGMVHNAFNPVRQQLEGMIPFADPDRQHHQQQQQQPRGQAGQANQTITGNGADSEPDPAQVAARLVAQRRIQNGNWLRDQARRIERAGILFLASFAPGVAERHIQQLEERERAERRAAEEARAAAAAQQQAQTETEAGADDAQAQLAGGE